MNNFISVIVCTYNRDRYIGECLEHLHNQTASKDAYEVLIVDNNSTDTTSSVCKNLIAAFPETQFRYFLETSQGLSHARNRGIQESKGNCIAFIDDDAFATPDYINKVKEYFSSSSDTLAIGGKITPRYERERPSWMSHYLLPLVAAQDLGDASKSFPKSKFPIGANMIFRREAFDTYGLFNTELGRKGDALESGEEKDFFQRLKDAGEKIEYVPGIAVDHIIPPHRVSYAYIKKMGIGIGKSERQRVSALGTTALLKKLISETIKAIGTPILFFGYLLSGNPAAGWMLIRFRYWVIKGLLFHS